MNVFRFDSFKPIVYSFCFNEARLVNDAVNNNEAIPCTSIQVSSCGIFFLASSVKNIQETGLERKIKRFDSKNYEL